MKFSWQKKLFSQNRLGNLLILNICLLAFSYPISAAIPVLLGINSTPINIGLRFTYLVIGLYLVIGSLLHKESINLTIGAWLLLFFWLIYSIRVNYDIHARGIVFGSYSTFKFYTLFYGSGILAATATLLTTKYINFRKLEYYVHKTIIAANISITLVVLYIYKTINPIIIAARVNFSVQLSDGSVQAQVLNPITIGYFGEILGLLSIYYLLFPCSRKSHSLLNYIALFLGMYVLIIGGSRGPFISFFLISLFIVALKLFRAKKTSKFYLKVVSLPTLFFIFFMQVIYPKIQWDKLTIFVRMKSWITQDYSNSLDNRDDKYGYAWETFLDHPILGSRYLDQFNSYPHNIFLEVLMALGIVGGIILFFIFSKSILKIFFDSLGPGKYIYFSILILSQILAGITSGSLFASYQLWILLALYLSTNTKTEYSRLIQQLN